MLTIQVDDTAFLCNILMYQQKYAQAKQLLVPWIEKIRRLLGPSHAETIKVLAIHAHICSCLNYKFQPYYSLINDDMSSRSPQYSPPSLSCSCSTYLLPRFLIIFG
mmetsp:Transcript_3731/g.4656  ORF Transcript_3731/g.4656 Transcript_3731/m.4656 type:complete len:106 (+) Transcript_3731:301-618(+)